MCSPTPTPAACAASSGASSSVATAWSRTTATRGRSRPRRGCRRARSITRSTRSAARPSSTRSTRSSGRVEWAMPPHWGQVMVTFPCDGGPWSLPGRLWHIDFQYTNAPAPLFALKVFAFFGDVAPQGGGTLIVSGSHRVGRAFRDDRAAGDAHRLPHVPDPVHEARSVVPRARRAPTIPIPTAPRASWAPSTTPTGSACASSS